MLEIDIIKNEDIDIYDYEDATELDNIAYELYYKEVQLNFNQQSVYYTQMGFVGSVGCEPFYEEATRILRDLKLKKIKNEIVR